MISFDWGLGKGQGMDFGMRMLKSVKDFNELLEDCFYGLFEENKNVFAKTLSVLLFSEIFKFSFNN